MLIALLEQAATLIAKYCSMQITTNNNPPSQFLRDKLQKKKKLWGMHTEHIIKFEWRGPGPLVIAVLDL